MPPPTFDSGAPAEPAPPIRDLDELSAFFAAVERLGLNLRAPEIADFPPEGIASMSDTTISSPLPCHSPDTRQKSYMR